MWHLLIVTALTPEPDSNQGPYDIVQTSANTPGLPRAPLLVTPDQVSLGCRASE